MKNSNDCNGCNGCNGSNDGLGADPAFVDVWANDKVHGAPPQLQINLAFYLIIVACRRKSLLQMIFTTRFLRR
ncbi:hypothetical protein ACO0K1_02335 [Undibacterium sp. SXout20W]